MDGLTFYKFLRVFKSIYCGSILNRVAALNGQLSFSFYHDAHKGFSILFKTTPPPAIEFTHAPAGDSFGVLSNLSGARLDDVTYREFDRLGYFHLSKRRPSGKLVSYTFVLEPMGNYSNAFLLNHESVVIFSLSSRNIDPDRNIGAGKPYITPKRNKKFDLRHTSGAASFGELTGFYPATAKLAEEYKKHLGFNGACERILSLLDSNDFFYVNDAGKVFPFPPYAESCNAKLTQLTFQKKQQSDDAVCIEIRASLIKYYEKQKEHYLKVLSKLESEFEEASRWREIFDTATLLQNNIHILKTGKNILYNYTESSVEKLDYEYTSPLFPSEYISKLFKKAAKLKRSLPLVERRTADIRQMSQFADEQIYFIGNASVPELKELRELIKQEKKGKESKKTTKTEDFLSFSVGEGTLYLGKNSSSNHKLVFGFAISSDIWLHARNIPSAHGILRKQGEPTLKEIEQAASIVAYHSKNKNEPKVAVDYTKRKYVRKPKNTPVGFVTYDKYSTLHIKPNCGVDLS